MLSTLYHWCKCEEHYAYIDILTCARAYPDSLHMSELALNFIQTILFCMGNISNALIATLIHKVDCNIEIKGLNTFFSFLFTTKSSYNMLWIIIQYYFDCMNKYFFFSIYVKCSNSNVQRFYFFNMFSISWILCAYQKKKMQRSEKMKQNLGSKLETKLYTFLWFYIFFSYCRWFLIWKIPLKILEKEFLKSFQFWATRPK